MSVSGRCVDASNTHAELNGAETTKKQRLTSRILFFSVCDAQVNTQNWNSCSGGNPPCDGSVNLSCAIDVWRWGGGTFKLWSTCGGCGACAVSAVNPEWDGSYPKGYDASRPFPVWATNSSDARIAGM